MKKRFALLTMLVVTLICLFAISVSAATTETTNIVKHDSDPGLDGAVSSVAGMKIPDYDAETGAYAYDIDARVVLRYTVSAATETEPAVYEYYVFPAYYVISQSSTFSYGFDGLNKALANAGSSLSFSKEGTHKCLSLIRLEIPNGVTSMTQGCKLEGSSNLKELIFPESLTNLGNVQDAFYNLAIESIDFSHVTSVNAALFSGCAQLKTVIWGASTVSARTFSSCSSLTSFILADGVELTSIGSYAFSKTGFVEFDMPDTVTTLGSHTFQSCTNLKRVNISASSQLTIIPERMFEGCDNIEYIYIPNGVTSIGTCAFEGRTKLTAVENLKNSSVVSIGESAFNNCAALTGVEFPSTLVTIGKNAFKGAAKNEGCYIIASLPNVVSLGQQAFYESGVKFLSLSEEFTYESNNWNTFMYCSKLEYADLSMCTVTTYPACFLAECSNLKVVELNEGLKTIPKQMFAGCTSLGFLYLPNSVTSFDADNGWNKGAFYKCTSLYFVSESYSIDSFLTDGLFDQAKYNQNKPAKERVYYFPEELTTLAQAFRECNNINEVIVVGENVTVFNETSLYGLGTSNETMTVVFLGEMTSFQHTEQINRKTDIIMPNTTEATLTTVATASKSYNNSALYLCSVGRKCTLAYNSVSWSDEVYHFAEKTEAIDATCELPAGEFTFCFCGAVMAKETVEGSVPLGHNKPSTGIVVYFPLLNGAPNYFANAHEKYNCSRCSAEQDEEVDNSALFVGDRGYSYEEEGTSVLYRLHVNVDNIKAYSDTFKYGIIVSGAPSTAPISLVDGKITYGAQTLVFEMQNANYKFEYIQAKVTNIGTAELNCQAYAIDNTTVTYIGHNNVNTLAEIVTYDAIVSTYSEKSNKQ